MTLEVYIDNALSYRIADWIPTRDGEQRGDGRQIYGEWLETMVSAESFERRSDFWQSWYRIAITIPTRLRLDKSYTLIDFLANPHDIPQPSGGPWWYWTEPTSRIGPSTTDAYSGHGIRWVMPHDVDNYDTSGTSWRLILRLYFTRISHLILRDPDTNNIILREGANLPGTIMHDA